MISYPCPPTVQSLSFFLISDILSFLIINILSLSCQMSFLSYFYKLDIISHSSYISSTIHHTTDIHPLSFLLYIFHHSSYYRHPLSFLLYKLYHSSYYRHPLSFLLYIFYHSSHYRHPLSFLLYIFYHFSHLLNIPSHVTYVYLRTPPPPLAYLNSLKLVTVQNMGKIRPEGKFNFPPIFLHHMQDSLW